MALGDALSVLPFEGDALRPKLVVSLPSVAEPLVDFVEVLDFSAAAVDAAVCVAAVGFPSVEVGGFFTFGVALRAAEDVELLASFSATFSAFKSIVTGLDLLDARR